MVKRGKASGPDSQQVAPEAEAKEKYAPEDGDAAKSSATTAAEPVSAATTINVPASTGGGWFVKKKEKKKKHGHIDVLHHNHEGPSPRFIIHPNSKYRRGWDMFTVIFVLYLVYIIPFDLAFDWWDMTAGVYYFGYMLDIWFAVDIIFNFRTGFTHDGHVVLQPSKIVRHYLAFWFWIDLLASIPFEIFLSGVDSKSQRKAIKMTKYFKIPRLMRMGRVLKYLRKYAKYSGAFIVIFGFILSCHFSACIWTMMFDLCGDRVIAARGGDLNKGDAGGQMPHGNPTAVVALQLDDPTTPGPDLQYMIPSYGICAQERVWDMYAVSVHYGMTMLLGGSVVSLWNTDPTFANITAPGVICLNDIIDGDCYGSMSAGAYLGSGIVMLLGIFFIASFFGEIAMILRSKQMVSEHYRLKVERAKREMSALGLDNALQYRVKRYYDYLWLNQDKHIGTSQLLNDHEMSRKLRADIALSLYQPLIESASFLRGASEDLLARVCLAMHMHVFMPDDWICRKGELGNELYFVSKGEVKVYESEDPENIVAILTAGACFGEIALLKPGGRRGTSVRAATICELNFIKRRDFDKIMDMYPKFAIQMRKAAIMKTELNRLQGESGQISDELMVEIAKKAQAEEREHRKSVSAAVVPGQTGAASNVGIVNMGTGIELRMSELELHINDKFKSLHAKIDELLSAADK